MEVVGALLQQGTNIVHNYCHNGSNQEFAVTYDGNEMILRAQHSQQVLSAKNGSVENNIPLSQSPYNNQSHQRFKLKQRPEGRFQIINAKSNKCATITNPNKNSVSIVLVIKLSLTYSYYIGKL